MTERPASDGNAKPRIALLWRGDEATRNLPIGGNNRLKGVADALAAFGAQPQPCVFDEAWLEDVRAQLLNADGVLVWVDPLSGGKDRSRLDPLLREAAARGVWVSAHPDTILKMGTKEVLFATRDFGWGADTALYRTFEEFRARFPAMLEQAGPRVLKQYRGNGGQGVWKVSRTGAPDTVRVLHARRGSTAEELSLANFVARCERYFLGDGRLIDQAFQQRLPEGMIRCYSSGDKVVGYGHQMIKALVDLPPDASEDQKTPGPRIMHDASAPPFQALRRLMETDWIPDMQRVLGIDAPSLPAIWDADFLYGPRTPSGGDTYVLCEINVSAVSPFPDQAAESIARAALAGVEGMRAATRSR